MTFCGISRKVKAMKTEFSTPFESWLVIALIAILSAPILGVVVSGCVKKEEVMLSDLAKAADSFGESRKPDLADGRFSQSKPLFVKEKARSGEAKESPGARRQASRTQAVSSDGGGKKTGSDSKSEGEKAKSLDPETSPALQSARRLLKIFEATEKALSDSKDGIEGNQGSREGK